jgi:hypothetical protein
MTDTIYTSKKSIAFQKWLEGASENTIELLVAMERSARMIRHSFQLMGEPDAKALADLIKTSADIEAKYEVTAS